MCDEGFVIGPNENCLLIHIDNEYICFMKDDMTITVFKNCGVSKRE